MYDCSKCGACCREGFDAVPVPAEDETTARAHPALVTVDAFGCRVLRRVPGALPERTRCVALAGDGLGAPFRCTIYADRPSACSGLDIGSEACELARLRVGLPSALAAGAGGAREGGP